VIVVTVALGVIIVHSWGTHPRVTVPTSTIPVGGSTTTTTGPPTSTSTTTARSQVKVLVANGSTTNGVAAGYATLLQRAGWSVLAPVTAKPPARATSVVYYATNKRTEADDVALSLGVPLSAVLPLSPATPVSNVSGADVVLVVGADLAAKTPPSTVPLPSTTTTAPKTTTTR